jgi:hypothetical protein
MLSRLIQSRGWKTNANWGHGIIVGIREVLSMIGEIATVVGFVSLLVVKIINIWTPSRLFEAKY